MRLSLSCFPFSRHLSEEAVSLSREGARAPRRVAQSATSARLPAGHAATLLTLRCPPEVYLCTEPQSLWLLHSRLFMISFYFGVFTTFIF